MYDLWCLNNNFTLKLPILAKKKNIWRCYFVFQAKCCGYGTNGQMTIGYDCVIIPISTLKNTLGALIPGSSDEFCGRALASQSNNGPATICSKKNLFFCYFLTIHIVENRDQATFFINFYSFSSWFLGQQIPFHVRFLSDTFEFLNEANVNPNGFRLHYEMLSCGSWRTTYFLT